MGAALRSGRRFSGAMTLADSEQQEGNASWENFLGELETEIQGLQRELSEINLMLEQSQVEVEKLTQRNASISANLQQVQSQIQDVPPEDIRVAYDAALEAQQRLVLMRGQLEKLQSDKDHIVRLHDSLQRVQAISHNGGSEQEANQASHSSIEIMTQAQESERQRLSRQMHDGPAQALSNFILQTEIAMRLFDVDADQARAELNNLKSAASTTFQKVRDFIFDLRPMMLDDLGLVPTLKRYAESFSEKSGIKVDVAVSGSENRLESYLEVVIFRAFQELISNKSLHEQAKEIKVQLDLGDKEVRGGLEDNGRGFDAAALPEDAELGIKAISERIEMLGGSFEIDSAVGQGARFSMIIPIGN
jgi:two-component system sensor histidine kinase DegS